MILMPLQQIVFLYRFCVGRKDATRRATVKVEEDLFGIHALDGYLRGTRAREMRPAEGNEREREEEIKVRARKEVRLAKQWRNSSSQLS